MKRKDEDNAPSSTGTSECTICMEPFSVSGKHRVVALRCGHLFGRGCITSWIDSKSNAGCPLCKEKVRKRDLRNIYSVTVTAVQDDGLADELRDTRRLVVWCFPPHLSTGPGSSMRLLCAMTAWRPSTKL
jgi:hypothetical protein